MPLRLPATPPPVHRFTPADMGKADEVYALIRDAATQHGLDSDDPDHEVGDLQAALRQAIDLMTPAQREELLRESCHRINDGYVDFDEFDPDDPDAVHERQPAV